MKTLTPKKQTIRNALREPKRLRDLPRLRLSGHSQCHARLKCPNYQTSHLFRGRRVLGHSLGAFRNSVLGQLAREDQADRSLDFSGRDGGLLVVGREFGGLGSDALEDVIDKRVQDGHGTVGDTSIGVHLLENCHKLVHCSNMGRGGNTAQTHPCRCRSCMSPCESWCASSSRQ
jgi:hypothetical protein